MSKKHIGIIAIVSVIVVCTASIGYIAYSGVWKDWFAGKWTNRYSYWFYIDCDADLYNVTLYTPILMAKGEISPLMNETIQHKPSNWTSEFIDTEYGKMLKISTGNICAGYYPIKIEKYIDRIINTENPVGNEPTLHPRINATGATYKSYLYAVYNTSANTKLTISIRIRGENYRAIGGAIEARGYEDAIKYTTVGEPSGWHVVNGILKIRGV